MLNKITIVFILIWLSASCKNNSVVEDSSSGNLELQETCDCFDGLGSSKNDKPVISFKFDNNKSISVCGYYDHELHDEGLIMSEFNIFDCNTGKSFVEYDAMQACRIIEAKDSVTLEELKFLPVGKDWSWDLIQIGEQKIYTNNNEITISPTKPKLAEITISNQQQLDFISSLKKNVGFGTNWEDDLGRLEVLSLIGNSEAWEILNHYEEFTDQDTDGAIAEQWSDAVATVVWIRNL